MARWIQTEDAGNQVDSRKLPVKFGEISENSIVQLMKSVHRDYTVCEVRDVFDILAIGVSKAFPVWKCTRYDFRCFIMHQGKHEFVLSLELRKKWLTLSLRYDSLGIAYSQIESVFPQKVTDPFFPGRGARTRVKTKSEANAVIMLLHKIYDHRHG